MESKYGILVLLKDILIIGDIPSDMISAKKVGCSVITVSTREFPTEELYRYGPDLVCNILINIRVKKYIKPLLT
jgi:phosphoglycolate phosphatase-like HAD superfamily hydrolase